jgi:Zn/Cd-binding protein ZinT
MAQYKCDFCDHEVDPRSSSVYHLITGWAKGATQNVKYVTLNEHKYAHEICMPRNAGEDQPSLF